MDAVIDYTRAQFIAKREMIKAGLEMVNQGKSNKILLDEFDGRWSFMKNLFENMNLK